jgi:WD40 repeat protein
VSGTEVLPPLQGHNHRVLSVAFSNDYLKIASGSYDLSIRIWDTATGTEALPPLQGHDGPVYSVAFSSDGSKIVSGSYNETIRVWDVSTGIETLLPLRGHYNSIRSVAFSCDSSTFMSTSDDKTFARTGTEISPHFQDRGTFQDIRNDTADPLRHGLISLDQNG